MSSRSWLSVTALLGAGCLFASPLDWPAATRFSRPWSYWWWMGSAVDPANLTRELSDFQKAGWGGVHIIPIYGAKGYEDKYIEYLSPKWMEMLGYTVSEGNRLGLGVDMTTGTGWCFGGPTITVEQAGALLKPTITVLEPGQKVTEIGFASQESGGPAIEVQPGWSPPSGRWRVYTLTTRPGIKVKRSSPGGGGYMINPFYGNALNAFLQPFSAAFDKYAGPKPRAMYHDSYEYQSDWSPDLLTEFERRRGYRLQDEFAAFFDENGGDRTARVKTDYRQTLSELLYERLTLPWVEWSHKYGFLTRNEAHGSPGNLLDLYAAADIPETEMFNRDRSVLVAKFASSAAHVTGKTLVSSETGTWLKEHFTERLADMKELVDQLFLSGVNHIVYHGSAYSPADAPWPGWLFYASTEMNSRNPIWHDMPALNLYFTRAQSMLQDGSPDNDVLVYWPISDLWHDPKGTVQTLTVHHRAWVDEQPVGKLSQKLLDRGYSFDYVSDRQLASLRPGRYKAIVVPETTHMPVETMQALAGSPLPVVFENRLPSDVPGLLRLEERRTALKKLNSTKWSVGDVEAGLAKAGVRREALPAGLHYIRRASAEGVFYFINNRGDKAFEGWVPLAAKPKSAVLMDAMTGRTGSAQVRGGSVWIRLEPEVTVFIRTWGQGKPFYEGTLGSPIPLMSSWEVNFVSGGPVLPPSFQSLGSWTSSTSDAARFAGTALYSTTFDAPGSGSYWIDLGTVAESAQVRLNGRDLGTLVAPPYRIAAGTLRAKGNKLEVEVTNLAANRIRDLDRRKVEWRVFHDINLVNLDYKPFDASNWPVRDSGLIGPVTLRPVKPQRN